MQGSRIFAKRLPNLPIHEACIVVSSHEQALVPHCPALGKACKEEPQCREDNSAALHQQESWSRSPARCSWQGAANRTASFGLCFALGVICFQPHQLFALSFVIAFIDAEWPRQNLKKFKELPCVPQIRLHTTSITARLKKHAKLTPASPTPKRRCGQSNQRKCQ